MLTSGLYCPTPDGGMISARHMHANNCCCGHAVAEGGGYGNDEGYGSRSSYLGQAGIQAVLAGFLAAAPQTVSACHLILRLCA